MLKKLFKLATVLGLLTASHLAYVRTFDLVVGRLRAARHVDPLEFAAHDSDNKRLVRETAERVFGRDHWTNSDDLLRYVSQEKGIILFAAEFSRPIESGGVKFDGKRIEVKPAALVLGSPKKGGGTKTLTSESATIDFDKAFGLTLKPGESSPSVRYARLERDVMIKDDRGTPDDPKDDLIIGPLTDVEYIDDGIAPLIRTNSDVVVVDRNLRVTGTGLEIQLRPKLDPNAPGGRASGFDGAQQLTLHKHVRTTFLDVGRTGMLPDLEAKGAAGAAKPVAAPAEPIPLDVQCDGPLVVALPHTPPAPPVGPPQPSDPTYVEFRNNVVVRRGKLGELPDQLTCDTLHLTLLPGEKKPAAVEAEAKDDKEKGDAFGGLTLRRVKASGHAVWLQMPAQGVKILCVELLHYKEPASGKNTTVFNGGGPKKLWLEKRDLAAAAPGAGPGKLQSVTHVWCSDATLTDDGDPDHAALVANGPGLLESRPALGANDPPRDVPPARTAAWREQLWVQNEAVEEGRVPGRVLVLKGSPKVEDRAQNASLESADRIVVWLNPDEKKTLTQDGREVVPASFVEPDPAAPPKAQALPSIRRLLAVKDVHLVDATRDLRLRDRLDVDFEAGTVAASPPPTPAPAAKPAAPAPAPTVNAEDAPDLTPVPAQGAAAGPKPNGPKMTARAERAQAVVIVGPRPPAAAGAPAQAVAAASNEPAYELRDVELRGSVQLHQEPGEGKTVGTDATGEVLVLRNEAKGQVVFDLYHHDQHSARGRAIDPKKAPKARVSTEEMTIEADTIGVDQKADQAWAYGEGKLTQLTDRSLFTDRNAEGLDAAAAEAEAKAKADGEAPKVRKRGGKVLSTKVPIVLTWTKLMTFEGISQDPLKRPAAKIKFLGRAHAQMEDSLLHGEDSITIYTDRPIPLVDAGKLSGRSKPKAPADAEAGAGEEPEPKADLAMIEVVGTPKSRAVAITRKVHPDHPVLISQQRMEAGSLLYDRRTGTFRAPGPGEVFLYDRKADPTKESPPAFDAAAVAVRPTAFRPGEDGPDARDQIAATPDAPRRAGAAGAAPGARPAFPPLVLTQIKFVRDMRGRFGSGVGDDVDEQRWAEFFGAVETARGNVANEAVRFDYDRLPADAAFLTSEMLRVINEPPPPGAARTSGGRNFLKAWDNAYVRARDTALQADVITYDSLNDLVYANGLEGRPVQVVQQAGVGQSASPGRASSVQFNPKEGSVQVTDPRSFQLIDTRTGTRPGVIKPSQMIPKEAPKRTKPFRPPTNPAERKGFTGR
ncbi:hypothetical protein [Paludisphaera soli]|uniref:hypothetical protein n=1 Tax=Paludisphaera soli TaxID=2712865 RepID=UPI0013EAF3A6|nr:hypothetical protein [Paludisphaera soli]